MHQHHHHHTHTSRQLAHVNKAFLFSIALNLLYVIAEGTAGIIYNSVALLSDAGHNISDIASLLLSLLAFRLTRKKSTNRFTYGYKKTTILAALTNAVILLIAVGVLGFEVVQRFMRPHPVQGNIIAWVAGLGIIVNALSAFFFFSDRKRDINVRSAFIHLAADAFVSLGVVVAGITIYFTGWLWLDPAIGLVVLIVVLISTWQLLSESFRLSVDAVPAGIDLETIKELMESVPDVVRVHHIHIWAMSTTENALTAHVILNDQLDFAQKMNVIKRIRHELEHQNITHSTIEIDS
jgi:cobalt-zinc-cadmium efflux system protein